MSDLTCKSCGVETKAHTWRNNRCPNCGEIWLGTPPPATPAELKCKGCLCDNHPLYHKKYDGYCFDCHNHGVPERDDRIAALAEQVAELDRLRAEAGAMREYLKDENLLEICAHTHSPPDFSRPACSCGQCRRWHARSKVLSGTAGRDLLARVEATEKERDHYKQACINQNHYIEQKLAQALGGFPWYKDDKANFPGSTEADGVCVGVDTAESLADMVAARVEAMQAVCDAAVNWRDVLRQMGLPVAREAGLMKAVDAYNAAEKRRQG